VINPASIHIDITVIHNIMSHIAVIIALMNTCLDIRGMVALTLVTKTLYAPVTNAIHIHTYITQIQNQCT
jgi:hypothetical protein